MQIVFTLSYLFTNKIPDLRKSEVFREIAYILPSIIHQPELDVKSEHSSIIYTGLQPTAINPVTAQKKWPVSLAF